MDQTKAPVDDQAAGVYWNDLGVFSSHGTLVVRLLADPDAIRPVLADAVRLVEQPAAATTNLVMNSFAVDDNGSLAVTYTVIGADSPPFSIGIYQSSDGLHTDNLAGTIDVSDPADLTGAAAPGTTHTLEYSGDLNGLDGGRYYIAKLDCYNEVVETTKHDNISAAVSGAFQSSGGSLYVLSGPNDSSGHTINISQNGTTGAATVVINGVSTTYPDTGMIYIVVYHGNNTINATGVTVPLTIYGGDGSDTIHGGNGGNTIYGGTAGGNHIYAGAGDDTIYGNGGAPNTIVGGAGTDTIYCGSGGDTVTGGSGNSEVYGGGGDDNIDVSAGQNNWVQAGSGGAYILGGSGHDWLYAGDGSGKTYTINGGNGTEVIHGGAGINDLTGGTGLDDIFGGSGTNFIYGHGIHDRLQSDQSADNYIQPNPSLASIEVKDSYDNYSFDGNIKADGSTYHGDDWALQSYPGLDSGWPPGEIGLPGYNDGGGYGGWWSFNDQYSGVRLGDSCFTTPVAVYATWDSANTSLGDGSRWASSATYKVSINGIDVGSRITVDQTHSCASHDSPEKLDRPWLLLGVWNVGAYDTIRVELFEISPYRGDRVCMGDVMIHAIWPEVHIRAGNVTVNPKVLPENVGDYVDWVDACKPVYVPVEGQGDRVPLQLSASIESLYYQVEHPTGTSTSDDWHAVLPNVTGLLFWATAIATTPLPVVAGNVIDAVLSGALGDEYYTYCGTVDASIDPDGAFQAGVAIPCAAEVQDEQIGATVTSHIHVINSGKIVATAVEVGDVDQWDSEVDRGSQKQGPNILGAKRWQVKTADALESQVSDLRDVQSQGGGNSTAFPTQPGEYYAHKYGDYLWKYQPDKISPNHSDLFAYTHPFAIMFDYTETGIPPIRVSMWESAKVYFGKPDSSKHNGDYSALDQVDWGSPLPNPGVTYKDKRLFDHQAPMPALDENVGKKDSNLAWGYLKKTNPQAPNTVRIVLTDSPRMTGFWDANSTPVQEISRK